MTLNRRLALLGLCTLVGASHARPSPDVMLGREAPAHLDPSGYLVSEKLDGVRALWDGRSLRFRSGEALVVPDGFTAHWPDQALDGELWIGRQQFQPLVAAVRRARPDPSDWRHIRYQVFDLPAAPGRFAERADRLSRLTRLAGCPWLQAVEQTALQTPAALQRRLLQVLAAGGEGLMLHRADALWRPGRSDALLKLKARHDAEAVVVGHHGGRGRHTGRLGALRVRLHDGTEFLLGTGLSDAQRVQPPPLGAVVTFTHQGFTAGGVPRFASFLRLREG